MLQPPTPPPITTARASVLTEPLPDQWYRPIPGPYDTRRSREPLGRGGALDHDARHPGGPRRAQALLGVLEDQHLVGRQRASDVTGQLVPGHQVALRVGLSAQIGRAHV